ncbi:MAG: sigma-70 family polymerase sigma factor [Flavipsychrobacter sp.]|jgi:RNA polymerase sigma-70 factor (ECF subfamily)|nr:sigma-70 family polymerase sigma factor [Flavipsychrobacter sp.]
MAELSDKMDDHMLVASFRNEKLKEASFTQLVRKYQERLYWHIRRMVVTHDDTNDILQNVFIKVWKNLGDFREESNLYTWLYRIGTNEALSWMEQQKRRSSVSIDDTEVFTGKLTSEKDFDSNKIEWRLQQAIQSLPEKQKVVFNLRYYDEMPYEDMANVLGTSVGALKASYHHAVKKVEAFLKEN